MCHVGQPLRSLGLEILWDLPVGNPVGFAWKEGKVLPEQERTVQVYWGRVTCRLAGEPVQSGVMGEVTLTGPLAWAAAWIFST